MCTLLDSGKKFAGISEWGGGGSPRPKQCGSVNVSGALSALQNPTSRPQRFLVEILMVCTGKSLQTGSEQFADPFCGVQGGQIILRNSW